MDAPASRDALLEPDRFPVRINHAMHFHPLSFKLLNFFLVVNVVSFAGSFFLKHIFAARLDHRASEGLRCAEASGAVVELVAGGEA
jgi:hypothetical protein